MPRTSMRASIGFALAALLLTPAVAGTWTIDSAHSAAEFAVRHLMISTVRGQFSKVAGTIDYDGKDVASIKVDATIDASTINTREAKRDEHLKSPDFFDAAKFPTITFKSKKATPGAAGSFKLTGDLTIRGITKEVTLDVEGPAPPIKDGWGNIKTGAHATTKINRKDFGVLWNKSLDGGGVVVGDEVTISIDLEAGMKAEEGDKGADKAPPKPSGK